MKENNFDTIIKEIVKPFGRWQMIMFLCMVLPMCCPMDMVLVFINISPPHFLASCSNNSISTVLKQFNHSAMSSCQIPPQNQSMDDMKMDHPMNGTSLSTVPCNRDYVFIKNKHEYIGTVTEEFALICDRAYLRSMSPMILMLGQCFSCLLSGWIADRFGRKMVIVVTGIGQFLLSLITPLSPNVIIFLVLQFFNGFFYIAIFNTCFILIMEVTDQKYRNILAMIVFINIGVINYSLSCIGSYFAQNWRNLYFMISVAAMPSLIFPFLIKESPRWLLVVGKKSEALTILKCAAKQNNGALIEEEEKVLEDFCWSYADYTKSLDSENTLGGNCLRILKSIGLTFRASSIRKRMLPLIYLWLQTSFVYYGCLFNSVQIGGNPYIVFWLTGVMMCPAGILRFILSKYIEHKTLLMSLVTSASISFGIMFCCQILLKDSLIIVIAALISKFQMDILFNLLYVYSPILIPTEIRNYGLGICSSAARLGSSLSPLVVQHGGSVWPPLPTLVSILLLVIGLCVSQTLPPATESLPDRVSDLQKLNVSKHQVSLKDNCEFEVPDVTTATAQIDM